MSNYDSIEDRTYWSHLGSIGIQAVRVESEKIKNEKSSVEAGTRSLAFDHYRTFIATADCGKDAAAYLQASQVHAENLKEKLPPLREACLNFESVAKTLSARRKSTSLVLSRHTRLLEVLELPQLMETCVRNGCYDEALELRQYATRIEKKLGSIPIVVEVVRAVRNSSKVMLNQLLFQLRAPIQLPACLKVVGYLRRMDAFGETELRLRFLQARDSWLCSVLKSVPRDDPYEHLSKTMELTRVHLFDIVTQYRALFSDDDPLVYAGHSNSTSSASSHRFMFSTWLQSKISRFLSVLEQDLQLGAKKQPLDSILSQAMYFGQSFSRVGADFRPSLVPILSKFILDMALDHLVGAEDKFKLGIDQMALKAMLAKPNLDKKEADQDPYQPPASLLDFQPLAELCNAILNSLNEVRLCAPLAIAPIVIRRVEAILMSGAQVLAEREARLGQTSIETEKVTFQTLVAVFCQHFLPYVDICLKRIFPPPTLSLVTSDAKFALDLERIHSLMPLKDVVVLAKPKLRVDIADEVPYVVDRVSVIAQEIEESHQPSDVEQNEQTDNANEEPKAEM